MIPFLRNLFAGSAGALMSMPANMLLLGPMAKLTGAPMLPEPPAGAELAEVQAFYAPMIAAMEPIHFAGPILAHWNGAFVGALDRWAFDPQQESLAPHARRWVCDDGRHRHGHFHFISTPVEHGP